MSKLTPAESAKIEISYRDADILFHSAFRYALGRMTYIVSDMAQLIWDNWAQIPKHSQSLIIKELTDAIATHEGQAAEGQEFKRLGMDMDYDVWKTLHERLNGL